MNQGSKFNLIITILIALILSLGGFVNLLGGWHNGRAAAGEKQGNFNEAEGHYTAGLALTMDSTRYCQAAQFYYRQAFLPGNLKLKDAFLRKALDLTNQAVGIDGRALSYHLRGRINLANRDLDLAESDFQKAIELDPWNNLDYHLDLAGLYVVKGDYLRADETIDLILEKFSPGTIQFLKQREKEVASQLRMDLAEVDLGKLKKLADLYYLKGKVKLNLAGPEEAKEFFIKALEIR